MISATDRRVVGIDASTGKTRWSAGTNTSAFITMNSSTVVLADSVGEYPDARAEVRGIDRRSGGALWSAQAPELNGSATALADSTSVVAMFRSPDGRSIQTHVLDPRSGETRWQIDGGEVFPAGSVVVLSISSRESGDLSRRVFDAHTGEELWSRTSSLSSSFSVVTPVGGRLAFVDDDGLTVVDSRTGKELWSRSGGIRIAADRHSIAAREGRTVTILDAATGSSRHDRIVLPEGYEAVNTFVLAGRKLYAGLGCTPND
jgi:outer membrane protein assembly factor BamB